MMRNCAFRLNLLAMVAFSAAPAFAETRAQTRDPAAAEVLFRQGRQAIEQGAFARACADFSESYRLDPAAGTLLNLADCEQRIGKPASAWQHFQQLAEQLPPNDERRPIALERIRVLEKQLPKLSITLVSGSWKQAVVIRDGVELGTASLGVYLPVNPGTHTIVVRAQGHEDRTMSVPIAIGEQKQVVAEPGRAQATGAETMRTVGYVLVGVGAASLATGAGLGLAALSREGGANCNGNICADQQSVSAHNDAKDLARIADIALGAGLLTAGVGGVFIWKGSSGASSGSHETRDRSARIAPSVHAQGGGLSLVGVW